MDIAIIGAGLQGWRRAQAIDRADGDRIALVCDANIEVARRLAAQVGADSTQNWEEAVESKKVDCIIVCTPPGMHAQISTAALTLGKHTLCEKPMGRNLPEALKIASVARVSVGKLQVGYNLRYHPAVVQIREWCRTEAIGRLMFVRGRYGITGRPGFENEWRVRPELSGGGQLMDQGLHLLDLSRWFLGGFTDVVGFLLTGFWPISPVEDNAFALLRTGQGQIASLHASWTQWRNLFCLEVFGTEGYCTAEGLGGSYGTERATLGRRQLLQPFAQEVIEFRSEDRSWVLEWREFRSSILEGRSPTCNELDGLEVLRLADAIYRSVQEARVVRVRDG